MTQFTQLGRSLADRVIECPSGCWLWTGRVNSKGYGTIGVNLAHRRVYTELGGTIPKGMEIDHKCFNRRCVNPDHLQVVTREWHIEQAKQRMAKILKEKTHCANGHQYPTEHRLSKKGYPVCRVCEMERMREWRKKNSKS